MSSILASPQFFNFLKKTLMPSAARAFGYVPFLFSFSCWFPAPPPPCLPLLFFSFCCSLPPASRASESWSPLFSSALRAPVLVTSIFSLCPPARWSSCALCPALFLFISSLLPPASRAFGYVPLPWCWCRLSPPPRAPPASGRVAVVLVSLRGAPVAVPLLPPSPPVPASCPGAGAA